MSNLMNPVSFKSLLLKPLLLCLFTVCLSSKTNAQPPDPGPDPDLPTRALVAVTNPGIADFRNDESLTSTTKVKSMQSDLAGDTSTWSISLSEADVRPGIKAGNLKAIYAAVLQ